MTLINPKQQKCKIVKKRKRVRFGSDDQPDVQTRYVSSVKREDLWHKAEAYRTFKKNWSRNICAFSKLHAHRRGMVLHQQTPPGLRTIAQIQNRKQTILEHTRIVLQEQQEQRFVGMYDPELISDVAERISRPSGYRAILRAVESIC